MKIIIFSSLMFLAILNFASLAFADRDWEYWSQETFSFPINEKITYLIIPEWRFKEDMRNAYLFKLETAPVFKVNDYLEVAPYYVYQEKKSAGVWDRSDLAYFDTTLKLALKQFWNIKLSNRLRYQYDFDKAKTTLRNSLRVSKPLKISKKEITPYFSEEPFYNAKLERITEHRAAAGLSYNLTKNTAVSLSYMLNSKKGASKWNYTNVLVSNINVRF
jgi:hypothetical protein